MNAVESIFNMTSTANTSAPRPEDFTTNATNSTIYEPPNTSDSHVVDSCPESHTGYCLNGGKCRWLPGIEAASCECVNNFEGRRCGFKILTTTEGRTMFGDYWEVFVIGTIFGFVILLTLILAILYICRKRKQAQASRRQTEEHAEAFIQNNYPVNGRTEHTTDSNQNTTAPDKYAPLAASEPTILGVVVADENETLETAFAQSRNSSTHSFKLQDPPLGRKSSEQSNMSASRESRV